MSYVPSIRIHHLKVQVKDTNWINEIELQDHRRNLNNTNNIPHVASLCQKRCILYGKNLVQKTCMKSQKRKRTTTQIKLPNVMPHKISISFSFPLRCSICGLYFQHYNCYSRINAFVVRLFLHCNIRSHLNHLRAIDINANNHILFCTCPSIHFSLGISQSYSKNM